ncbi:hypothetical protein ACRRTK_021921 [Alexandromys fortis]
MADPCVPSPSNHPLARAFAEAAGARMRGGRAPLALEYLLLPPGFQRVAGARAFPAEQNGYSLELLRCAAPDTVRKLFCGSLQVGCPVAASQRELVCPGERDS